MMWLKLAGALLIMGSTSAAGWKVAEGYARRPQELRDLLTCLALLETEIDYGSTPLPAALRAASRATAGRVGSIFAVAAQALETRMGTSPAEAMNRALTETAHKLALSPRDTEVLAALAGVLGSSGRQDQIRHLQLACQRLAGEECQAQADRSRYVSVARYAGLFSGAALVLILV